MGLQVYDSAAHTHTPRYSRGAAALVCTLLTITLDGIICENG